MLMTLSWTISVLKGYLQWLSVIFIFSKIIKVDGKNPALASATTGGKILIH